MAGYVFHCLALHNLCQAAQFRHKQEVSMAGYTFVLFGIVLAEPRTGDLASIKKNSGNNICG